MAEHPAPYGEQAPDLTVTLPVADVERLEAAAATLLAILQRADHGRPPAICPTCDLEQLSRRELQAALLRTQTALLHAQQRQANENPAGE